MAFREMIEGRIGASAFSDFEGTVHDFVDLVCSLGFTGIEWRRFIGTRHAILLENTPLLREVARGAGLPTTVHLPAHLNLTDPVEGQHCFDEYAKGIQAAAEVGADIVVIHGGVHPDTETGYAMSIEALVALDEKARKQGVTLALENSERSSHKLFQTPQDFARIEQTDLRIVLDVGHFWTHGITLRDALAFGDLAQRLVEIHLHDNDGSGDQHLALGRGTIDFADVFAVLKERSFTGVYTVEAKTVDRLIQSAAFLGLTANTEDSASIVQSGSEQ